MIRFCNDNGFALKNSTSKKLWIRDVVARENLTLGEITYVFCNDDFMLNLNQKYLDHNTYTDIISFDYSVADIIAGEIYISTERVRENAKERDIDFELELDRVLIHGILHFCGYLDKTEEEKRVMRRAEDRCLTLRKS